MSYRDIGENEELLNNEQLAAEAHRWGDLSKASPAPKPWAWLRCSDIERCESPIERDMFRALCPWLGDGVDLEVQPTARTPFGGFRFDFMLTGKGRRIVIECDGKAFHNEWRDEWRDALTLGYGLADEVVRFDGSALYNRAEDCAFILRHWHPWLASPAGMGSIGNLSSLEVRRAELDGPGELVSWWRTDDDGKVPPTMRRVQTMRRRKNGPAVAMWRKLHAYAVAHAPCSLDRLIADHAAAAEDE